MILDKELLLSDGQEITATAVSENTIDLSAALRDIGAGEQLYVVVVVDVAAAAGDAAKELVISLITSAAEELTSETTILSTPTLTGAVLTKGRVPIVIPIPPGIAQQYLGLNYVTDTFGTAFEVTAFIAKDVQTNL